MDIGDFIAFPILVVLFIEEIFKTLNNPTPIAKPASLPMITCGRITKRKTAALASSMILGRSGLRERGSWETAPRNIILTNVL